MTMTDSILSDVLKARENYTKQFDGDVHRMMADLRRRNQEAGRVTVTREPKIQEKTSAAD
jgi:hypothetical protein